MQPAVGMLEIQTNRIALNGHMVVDGTRKSDVLLIGNSESGKAQAKPAILFVTGVNIVNITDIDCYRQTRIGEYLRGL